MTFDQLKLHPNLLQAIKAEGYLTPTPIQERAIPHVLAGRDLLGCAQTGTGKTAAFALPVLQRLGGPPTGRRPIRCLVITPTRELAAQIHANFVAYGRHTGLTCAVIFGGVGQGAQVQALQRGVDILVATPGRLLDLMSQRHVVLAQVQVFVLDEADRMLDMGFIQDVKRIAAQVPKTRQTLLFSATMPPEIASLAKSLLNNPEQVSVAPASTAAETIDQQVYFVPRELKRSLLLHLLENDEVSRAVVFTRTKRGSQRLAKQLLGDRVRADAIHGDKAQSARQRALEAFREGQIRVLVATDIAARGLDIEGITHVVNFDIPEVPESYVHRIGRTGRASASGIAIAFCSPDERPLWRDIERVLRHPVRAIEPHPFMAGSRPPERPSSRSIPAQVRSEPRVAPERRGRRPEERRRARNPAPPRANAPAQPLPPRQSRPSGPKWF